MDESDGTGRDKKKGADQGLAAHGSLVKKFAAKSGGRSSGFAANGSQQCPAQDKQRPGREGNICIATAGD